MAVDVKDKLERELYDVKEYASGLSAEVQRLKKELGSARKAAQAAADLEVEVKELKEQADAQAKNVRSLVQQLAKRDADLAALEEKVDAAKAIADGLAKLRG